MAGKSADLCGGAAVVSIKALVGGSRNGSNLVLWISIYRILYLVVSVSPSKACLIS